VTPISPEKRTVVHLISYDLNGHERPAAYEAVRQVIESAARDFRRPLRSQWLVNTAESADAWAHRLYPVLDADDRLLICEVTSPNQGWLPEDIWLWLNARVRAHVT
jgi:hypothetical protein